MVVRFLTGRFIWEYSAEERLYIHRCSIDCDSDHDGSDVVLEILDTESKVRSFPKFPILICNLRSIGTLSDEFD